MTNFPISPRLRRTLLAIAVSATFAPVQAEVKPVEAVISVGVGAVSGSADDRALFGQYTGLHDDRSLVGMLGIDYSLRKPDTSTWVDFRGSNLLGETRELGLVWKNPGSWKLTADYGQLVHSNLNTVNTGLLGVGSTTPQVVALPAGSGIDTELKTKRTKLGIGLTKIISPTLQFAIDLNAENKEGSRLSGIGMNCPSTVAPTCLGTPGANTSWALLMLPEPISANHSQVEARLSYALEKLRFSVGYYGSFYRNSNATLSPTVPASLYNPLGSLQPLNTGLQSLLSQPLALAPDNQAQQLDLSGSYDFTHTTHATFKLGYTSASQTDDFANAGLGNAPAGVTNLGAQVNTRLAKIGLTSRPIPKLSLLADLRYEDKNDTTPIAYYDAEGLTNNTPLYTTNRDLSNRKTSGKLQASWQFTNDYRGTLGADRESIDRGAFAATSSAAGISALRQKTDETTVHAELRRRMGDDLSGSISLSSSRRSGSNWLKDNSGAGVTEVINPADLASGFLSTAIFMPTLVDRKRDKARLFADWQASEKLNLQFGLEGGRDNFTSPSNYGLQNARLNQFSLDATYALSDAWGINGNLFRGVQSFNQARPAGYLMAFENTNLGAAIGASGKASAKLNVGVNLSYVNDRNVYAQGLDSFAGADSVALLNATGGLPDVVFSQTALKLFGKYALENKGASVRLDLVHQRSSLNDWAWSYNGVPFAYSDGTTALQKPTQNVSFIGVTYIYLLP
jgi:MtrB/PioB family decaheme-associated outer membrane protein